MLFKPETTDTTPDVATEVRPGRWRRRLVSSVLVLLILGGLGYLLWGLFNKPQQQGARGGPGGFGGNLPVPVLAATPKVMDVPVYFEGVGTVRALNTVTVRAQVDGRLAAVLFKEGQDVERGDILAEIDPAIYRAQLDQALAKKAQDEATLANARLDLTRYQQLAQSNAGSKQQADTQKATVAQLEALIRSDQAAIDNAQTLLDYTKVRAPISGRAGLRQVDQGNIIRSSDANGLVVITQVRPIAVQYSLPQQQLSRVNAALGKGQVPVDVFGNDGRSIVQTGFLEGVDNQVDPTTGTVKLKAVFPNAGLVLWPGQFVNVRTKVDTLVQATVVPTAAVQRGPAGTYAYVIGANDVANAKPITVTQQTDTEAVIASGLSPQDRVVTTGFANLAEGSRVLISQDTEAPTPDLAPQRRRQGSGAGGGQGRSPLNAGQKGSSEPGASGKGTQGGRPPEGGAKQ